MFATAPAPARAHTSFTLAWGLFSLPLGVYTGTEETRVERKEFLDSNNAVEIGRKPYRKDNGDTVDNSEVVRMAQASNGTWVVLTDDEQAACTSPKGLAEVESFVSLKDIDQYLTVGQMQVRPKREKGKANPATEKSFALLLAAMSKRKVAALVKLALRGPAKYYLLTPDGDLRLIFTADQVREALPLPEYKPSKAEADMALSLIDVVGVDTPVLTDDTAPAVQAFVDAKAGGAPAPVVPVTPASNDDIMSILAASIEAAKQAKAA